MQQSQQSGWVASRRAQVSSQSTPLTTTLILSFTFPFLPSPRHRTLFQHYANQFKTHFHLLHSALCLDTAIGFASPSTLPLERTPPTQSHSPHWVLLKALIVNVDEDVIVIESQAAHTRHGPLFTKNPNRSSLSFSESDQSESPSLDPVSRKL